MKIVQITENQIYCYSDYTFMMFDIGSLVTSANRVGFAWPIGKCKTPDNTPTGAIKKDSCYHNVLMAELIDIARNAMPD